MSIGVYTQVRGADRLVGHIYPRHGRGRETTTFHYDEGWLALPGAFALAPALPMTLGAAAPPGADVLFGCFADSAPDRWGRALIRRRERRQAEAARGALRTLGEVDMLLGVRDDLRQGALRFRASDTDDFLAPSDRGVPALMDLPVLLDATGRIERNVATDEDLALLLRAGSSLGGGRPKAHVLTRDGRLAIAKFPSRIADEWDVIAWEWVALELARGAGIRVPPAHLEVVAGHNVLVIQRFDRTGDERVGYVSAMTMLEARDGDQRSYLEIADTVELLSPAPAIDLEQLWRRIAFSVLIRNTDDHLRNHGFLHSGGNRWVLSPAFDLNPNPAAGDDAHLSTAIDFDGTSARIDRLMSIHEYFRLTGAAAVAVLADVFAAVARWRHVARRAHIAASEIALMEPAFAGNQAADAAALLGA